MTGSVLGHVPLTAADLGVLAAGDALPSPPVHVAVAPADARPDDRENAEFDALCEAAAGSVQRILDDGARPLRIVAAAEVAPARISADGADQRLDRLVRADVVALYVDEDATAEPVAALVAAAGTPHGPTDDQYDAVETRLLLWHAPSELDDLARELAER